MDKIHLFKGQAQVILQGTRHVDQPAVWRQLHADQYRYMQEGFQIFYEGVTPLEELLELADLNPDERRVAMLLHYWVSMYDPIAEDESGVAQTQGLFYPPSAIRADIDARTLVRELVLNGLVVTDEFVELFHPSRIAGFFKKQETAVDEEYEAWEQKALRLGYKEISQQYQDINLAVRDRIAAGYLVKYFEDHPAGKAVLIYGWEHLPGLVKELESHGFSRPQT